MAARSRRRFSRRFRAKSMLKERVRASRTKWRGKTVEMSERKTKREADQGIGKIDGRVPE